MKTNRISRHCAQWFAMLVSANLATRQEIIDSRRRLAERLAREMRERRKRRTDGDCEGAT